MRMTLISNQLLLLLLVPSCPARPWLGVQLLNLQQFLQTNMMETLLYMQVVITMEAARRRKIFLAESPGTPKRWRRSKKKKRDETAPAPAVPAEQHNGGVSQN